MSRNGSMGRERERLGKRDSEREREWDGEGFDGSQYVIGARTNRKSAGWVFDDAVESAVVRAKRTQSAYARLEHTGSKRLPIFESLSFKE